MDTEQASFDLEKLDSLKTLIIDGEAVSLTENEKEYFIDCINRFLNDLSDERLIQLFGERDSG